MNPQDIEIIQSRTVKVLTAGQVLGGFGLGSVLSIGALMAEQLSGSAAWSGSAATFSTLGAAVSAIPMARMANKLGRRKSLATGAAIAITGASLIIVAGYTQFFPILLVALFMLGAGSATSLQARFAATDLPSNRSTGRDLSVVVWAATVGAVAGPNLFGPGEALGHTLHMPPYTGPFLFTIVAQFLSATIFWIGLRPDPLLLAKEITKAENLGIKAKASFKSAIAVLRTNRMAAYSVFAIALSHMIMVSVMSMTPVHLRSHGATLVLVGFTVSLHIAGMYAFSPIFGWLADKIGKIRTIVLGQFIYLAALAFAGFGSEDHTLVAIGLFLLGLGWSASVVGGSALLASSLSVDDKANVQGVSDSLMSFSGAVGGAIAGSILTAVAFSGLNAAALIPAVLVLIASGIANSRRA